MKKLLLLSLSLFISSILYSQIGLGEIKSTIKPEFCTQKLISTLPSLSGRSVDMSAQYCFRLYLHRIRRDDETGGLSDDEIHTAIEILKDKYKDHGINFHVEGDIINHDNSIEYISPKLKLLVDYNHTDGIDIIFAPSIELNLPGSEFKHIAVSANGALLAGGQLDSTGIIIGGVLLDKENPNNYSYSHIPVALSPVIAHEVGHVLQLGHTFDGSDVFFAPTCDNLSLPADNVDDTPFDPRVEYWDVNPVNGIWDGTTDGTVRHLNCTRPNVNPDVTNIMSYGPPNILNGLTLGQVYRMKDFMQNTHPIRSMHLTTDYVRIDCDTSPVDCISSFPKISENVTNVGIDSNIYADNENNIIFVGYKQDYTSDLITEGTSYSFENIISKYNSEGCLLWIKELAIKPSMVKLDNENNIYIATNQNTRTGNNIQFLKLNKNGNQIWFKSYDIDDSIVSEFDVSNDQIFFFSGENSLSIPKVWSLDTIDGLNFRLKYQQIENGNNIKFTGLKYINSTDEIIITANLFGSGNFNFNGTPIIHNSPLLNSFAGSVLLKFNNSSAILYPIQFKQFLYPLSILAFNEDSKNLLFYDVDLNILNVNNLVTSTTNTINNFSSYPKTAFYQKETNTFVILSMNYQISKLIDDSSLISNGLNYFSIPSHSNIIQLPNGLIFSSGIPWGSNQIAVYKIDPITGEFLTRNNLTTEKLKPKIDSNFFTVTPNPFKENFKITFNKSSRYKVFLLDSFGKTLFNKSIEGANYTLPNLNLKSGTYFAKCIDISGRILVKRLIKE
jgi:hypothetical protein